MDLSPTPTDLLLNCLRFDDPAARLARLGQYGEAEQWTAIIEQAQLHGLTSYVAGLLIPLARAIQLPEPVLEQLRTTRLKQISQNLLIYHTLHRLLQLFNSAGISVIALKGVHLARFVYQDISLRGMSDIDLLINPEQLARAAEIVEAQGYRASNPYDVALYPQVSHQLPHFLKQNAPIIELHTSLSDPGMSITEDLPGIWQRAQSATFDGLPAQVLCAEDLLLHSVLHAAHSHSFNLGLRPLLDQAMILKCYRAEINWDVLTDRAAAWNLSKSLYVCLQLAADLLDAPVPGEALERLAPSTMPPMALETLKWYVLTRPTALSTNVAELYTQSAVQTRYVRLFRRVFIGRTQLGAAYNVSPHSIRIYWFYLIRLAHLLRENWLLALRLLRHDTRTFSIVNRQGAVLDILNWMVAPTSFTHSARASTKPTARTPAPAMRR
ncbi:MAG: nucleotidyltransferase family protein [Chloroflexota bacterium]